MRRARITAAELSECATYTISADLVLLLIRLAERRNGGTLMALPYRLDSRYRIASDSRQWVLQRLRGERDADDMDDGDARPTRPADQLGEELWSDTAYYPTIEGCCRYWSQRAARESDEPLPQALRTVLVRLEQVLKDLRGVTEEGQAPRTAAGTTAVEQEIGETLLSSALAADVDLRAGRNRQPGKKAQTRRK